LVRVRARLALVGDRRLLDLTARAAVPAEHRREAREIDPDELRHDEEGDDDESAAPGADRGVATAPGDATAADVRVVVEGHGETLLGARDAIQHVAPQRAVG